MMRNFKFLHDVRQTIAELVSDAFYTTLNKLAHQTGLQFQRGIGRADNGKRWIIAL
jgi:hypothetical protein